MTMNQINKIALTDNSVIILTPQNMIYILLTEKNNDQIFQVSMLLKNIFYIREIMIYKYEVSQNLIVIVSDKECNLINLNKREYQIFDIFRRST